MLENRDSAVPVIPVAAARPSRGLAGIPLLALCCLLCTLLVIASTIVLALIPIYLQTATAAATAASQPRYTNFDLGTQISDGALPTSSANAIADPIRQGLGYPAGSVGVTSATAATTNTGKRRRRALQQRDRRVAIAGFGIQLIYVVFFIILTVCRTACSTVIAAFILPAFILTINGIAFSVPRQSVKASTSNPNVSPNSAVTASTTGASTASVASSSTTIATTTTGMING